MIAMSTMTTAVKILKTKKPVFLFSRLVVNERKTAIIQPLRKSLACEGFIYRAATLLNKMGLKVIDTQTDVQAKRMIRDWVINNISFKPRQMLQNMRFNQVIIRPQELVEADVLN